MGEKQAGNINIIQYMRVAFLRNFHLEDAIFTANCRPSMLKGVTIILYFCYAEARRYYGDGVAIGKK